MGIRPAYFKNLIWASLPKFPQLGVFFRRLTGVNTASNPEEGTEFYLSKLT